MNESEFTELADAALARISEAVEDADVDCDCSLKQEGVLDIEFDSGAKIIVNRHAAAREIWVADRSGGFHFRRDGERWVDTRDGTDLFAALSRLLAAHVGQPVTLKP